MAKDELEKQFGNKIRIRVMGIFVQNDAVLMINHKGLNDSNEYWLPPGGGVEFGESCKERLIKEFQEEAGLEVEVGQLLFVNEFLKPPFHAIELFFEITSVQGEIRLGNDPEMNGDEILSDIKFIEISDFKKMQKGNFHPFFEGILNCQSLYDNLSKSHFQ